MAFDTEEKIPRAVLVGVHTGRKDFINDCTDESMDELGRLAETAGAETAFVVVQNKQSIDNALYVGEGKAEEIRLLCEGEDIDVVIFDDELSPSQLRNLERIFGVRVIDRSMLIMDIFAARANTKEGKIQVELAQLRYILPRLSGVGAQMSRLGAGIGTRGPGETKLESDRRHIRRRIEHLQRELSEIVKHRNMQRKKRGKEGVIQVALVGYTNAGKSTLLNRLTDAGVLAEDKLFATLDPTARKLTLPEGGSVLLIDTVGFIRKLPHHLIRAFKSTLEEAVLADVLVHVADASSPHTREQIEVVEKLLAELGAEDNVNIMVLNKCDLADGLNDWDIPKEKTAVKISAATGSGIENFLKILEDNLPGGRKRVELLVPFSQGEILNLLHQTSVVTKEEYTAGGTQVEALVDAQIFAKVKGFCV